MIIRITGSSALVSALTIEHQGDGHFVACDPGNASIPTSNWDMSDMHIDGTETPADVRRLFIEAGLLERDIFDPDTNIDAIRVVFSRAWDLGYELSGRHGVRLADDERFPQIYEVVCIELSSGNGKTERISGISKALRKAGTFVFHGNTDSRSSGDRGGLTTVKKIGNVPILDARRTFTTNEGLGTIVIAGIASIDQEDDDVDRTRTVAREKARAHAELGASFIRFGGRVPRMRLFADPLVH